MAWIRLSAKHHHRRIRPDVRSAYLKADPFLSRPSAGLCICNEPCRRNRPDASTTATARILTSARRAYKNTQTTWRKTLRRCRLKRQKSKDFRAVSSPSYLLNVVFVQNNGSVVEKGMIEGVWKQPTELHTSATVQRRPAMLQAEADEAETAHSNTEEQQIMLLLSLIPASLGEKDAYSGEICIFTEISSLYMCLIWTSYIYIYMHIQYMCILYIAGISLML